MLAFYLFLLVVPFAFGAEHHFYWNTSNPIWDSDDPTLTVRLWDRIRIHCPRPDPDHKHVFIRVYQVSEFSASDCILESGKQQVLLCDGKHRPSTVVTIRSRSATPNALTFEPLSSYYWISTSSGDEKGLERQMNGLCKTNNMRLRVDVMDTTETTTRSTTTTTPSTTTTTTSTTTTTEEPDVPRFVPVHYPPARSVPETNFLANLPENVDKKQLADVFEMARKGRTGTFRHTDSEEKKSTWDPVSIGIYNGYRGNQENILYDSIGAEEVTYQVHEEDSHIYAHLASSSSSSLWSLFISCFLVLLF